MSDSVKNIFKALIKVPIIIVVSFAIFNVFAFTLSYMKVLGLSYVTLQTAMENNFIPAGEQQTIQDYMNNSLQTEVLQEIEFTPNTTFNKQQYGEVVTVGVQANYKFIWPLTPLEQVDGEFMGMDDVNTFGGFKTRSELQDERDEYTDRKHNINIEYTVPGLKYYPDLN